MRRLLFVGFTAALVVSLGGCNKYQTGGAGAAAGAGVICLLTNCLGAGQQQAAPATNYYQPQVIYVQPRTCLRQPLYDQWGHVAAVQTVCN